MSLEKEFGPYPEALELKELGFDEPCFGYYKHTTIPNRVISNDLIIGFIKDNRIYNDTSNGNSLVGLGKGLVFAPTFSQAFRWFREKYNYDIVVSGSYNSGKKYFYRIETAPTIGLQSFGGDYRTYEEAELACLRKLIAIVKNK